MFEPTHDPDVRRGARPRRLRPALPLAPVRVPRTGAPRTYDWAIIGGGPHGVCAAQALVAGGASLRIVEPTGALLQRWRARAEAVAMTWMRSPANHHLDAQIVSLHHFLHRPENADLEAPGGRLLRPSHAAFLRHSLAVVREHRLDETIVAGRVDSIRPAGDALEVSGSGVDLRARRVLIATGSNVPRVPRWAWAAIEGGAPIDHVFGCGARMFTDVVGGGISAVQRALAVHRATGRTVRLWARAPIRVAEFDFDRQWGKHRFLAGWAGLGDEARLAFLERHRRGGSVPAGLQKRLERAVARAAIELEIGVPGLEWDAERRRLVLCGERRVVESDGVTLATGFRPEQVSGWLRTTAEELGLPTLRGVPRLDDRMHWGSGIHVTGPLACLGLGPVAGNLIGARWATARLPGTRMQPV